MPCGGLTRTSQWAIESRRGMKEENSCQVLWTNANGACQR